MSNDAQEMTRFLTAIVKRGGQASPRECPLASREQDKVRKAAKRRGWVKFLAGSWCITEDGRKALANK